MPRNGSGLYVPPPANYPAVPATTITAANRNAIDADIATALTNSIAVNGESVVTADIPFGNNKLTGVKDGTLAKDAANVSQIQNSNAILLATVAGTDTITASLSPALTAYANGQIFTLIPANTNTGAVTININGLGAKALTKNGSTALVAGDLVAGVEYSLQYDGTRFQKVAGSDYAKSGANSDITSLSAVTSVNGGSLAGIKNVAINGGFTINQRGYVSAAVLASGIYGHDRWKAGAGGGDYSFTQLASNTQITIASGKSLIQVVEDKNVHSTSYVLSWIGTAQARIGVNSATPSGAYAASPILITGQTAGAVMSVEFSTGTLGNVQIEAGSIATKFEHRPYQTELALCQRYYWKSTLALGITALAAGGFGIKYPVTMRVTPTLSNATFFVGVGNPGTAGALSAGIDGLIVYNTASNWSIGAFVGCSFELTGAEI